MMLYELSVAVASRNFLKEYPIKRQRKLIPLSKLETRCKKMKKK